MFRAGFPALGERGGRHRPSLLLAALLLGAQAEAGSTPSVAFFYGRPVPVERLSRFDWVVLEPENVQAHELEALRRRGVNVFGYLSLGEVAPGSADARWSLGPNSAWGSVIVDPSAEGWRQRILERAGALWERGYAGVFLDTLDSYAIVLRGDAQRTASAAMAALIRAIHQRHPGLKLFFNRGFEILEEVGALAAGVAAESLIFGWNAAEQRYFEVADPDREWLAHRLRHVEAQYGIPVVVVDYLPPARRAQALEAARRIRAMGFVPWISTPALDVLGVGALDVGAVATQEARPRRVLVLYDGAETPSVAHGPIARLATPALQSLGCDVEYVDVRTGLPTEPLENNYAGVVTWFTDDDLPSGIRYPQWLARQIESGVRIAIVGRPGFAPSRSFLAMLGLAAGPELSSRISRVARRDAVIELEGEPTLRTRGLLRWHAVGPEVVVHLRVEDERGRPIDPVVTAPWGGLALEPYVLERGYEGRVRWIVSPAKFLQAALGIAP